MRIANLVSKNAVSEISVMKAIAPNAPHYRLKSDRTFKATAKQVRDRFFKVSPG
jgi:hypothetical protein